MRLMPSARIQAIACVVLVVRWLTCAGAAAQSLDLESSAPTVQANNESVANIQIGGTVGSNGTVEGGTILSVGAGQMLTPAQYAALSQVLAGTGQSLVIGNQGNAVAGSVAISPGAYSNLTNLSVPAGVAIQAVGFGNTTPLSVSGAASIQGALYALQPAQNIASVLNFSTLNILPGGLLSAAAPGTASNLFSSAGLTVNVAGTLLNQGTISSPAGLTINAQSIVNQSTSFGAAQIIASQVLNLNTLSGSLINTGLIAATNQVNITTLAQQALNIHNDNGTISAAAGAINIRELFYSGKSDITATGGAFLSRELNLFGGCGNITVNAGDISGLVNVSGGTLHLSASNEQVQLGTIELQNDPVFYNSTGSFVINGTITTNGGDLAILANRDITIGGGVTNLIDTHNPAGGRAGNVWLIAGVDFTPAGSNTCCGPGDTSSTFSLTGPSASGGDINLVGGGPLNPINATGTGTDADGGSVTMVAAKGRILLGAGLAIQTGGTGTGMNGDVTVLANPMAAGLVAISLQGINASGGTGGGGNITIDVVSGLNGNGVSLANSTPSTITQTGVFTYSSLANGDINLNGQALITTNPSSTTSTNIHITTLGKLQLADLSVNGSTAMSCGGSIYMYAGQYQSTGTPAILTANGAPDGNGGSVIIQEGSGSLLRLGSGAADHMRVFANGGAAGSTSGSAGNVAVLTIGPIQINGGGFNAAPLGTNGKGASLTLNSPVNISVSTNINLDGKGTGDGGTLLAQSLTSITTAGATRSITANAGSNGAGGSIALLAITSTVQANATANGFQFQATGGTVAGKGGTIAVLAQNIIGDGSKLETQPLSANADGGQITLSTSLGSTKITGSLNVNGTGTGKGGTVNLAYSSNNPLIVGAPGADSFVSGNITADGGTAGGSSGGTISITNSGAPAQQIIDLRGSLSTAGKGTIGTITLNQGGRDLIIQPSVGSGTLVGRLVTTAKSALIDPKGADSIVGVQNVNVTSGSLIVQNPNGANAAFTVASGATLQVNGNILVDTIQVGNSGTISATGTISLNLPNGGTFDNSGSITSAASGSAINVSAAAGDLTLTGNGSLSITGAGYDELNFTSTTGKLTVNSNYNLSPGATGTGYVNYVAKGGGGSLTFGAGSAQSVVNGNLSVQSPTISFGAGSALSATEVDLTSGGVNAPLRIIAPANASATITGSPDIFFVPTAAQALLFLSSLAGAPAALSLTGNTSATVVNADTTISADVTLSTGALITTTTGGSFLNSGSISATNDLTLRVSGGSFGNAGSISTTTGMVIEASSLSLGNGSLLMASNDIIINPAAGPAAATTIATTGIASIQTTGKVLISSSAGQALSLIRAGAGAATLNVAGTVVSTTTTGGAAVDIGSGLTIQANTPDLDFVLNGDSTFTDNGVITSSAPGSITVQSDGNLTLNGTPGLISATGAGVNNINFSAGAGKVLSIDSNYSFNPGNQGFVNLQATGGAAPRLDVAAGNAITVSGGGTLDFISPNFNPGSNTTYSAKAINVVAGSPSPLQINLPSGGSATFAVDGSSSGFMFVGPNAAGQSMTIAGPGTLVVAGGPFFSSTDSAPTTIDAGVTISGVDVTLLTSNSILTNNGTVNASAGITLVTNNGQLANNGTISAGGLMQLQALTTGASSIINDGTLSANQLLLQATAVSTPLNFTNNGTLSVNTSISAQTQLQNSPLSFTNNSMIQISGTIDIQSQGAQSAVTFNNSATVQAATTRISSASGLSPVSFDNQGALTTGNASTGSVIVSTAAPTSNVIVPATATGTITAGQVRFASGADTIISNSTTYNSAGTGIAFAALSNITLMAGTTQTVTGGGTINFTAPTISLGAGASITATGASSYNLTDAAAGTLRLIGPGAGNFTSWSTVGGNYTIAPSTAGNPIDISGGGRLNFLGGALAATTTNGQISVGAGTNIVSDQSVSVTANGAAVTILDGGGVAAAANLTISAGNTVSVGTLGGSGASLAAGTLGNGYSAASTSLTDYDMSGIVTPGVLTITTTAGNIAFGDNSSLVSLGGNLSLSGQAINAGSGNSFVSQGGSVLLNAALSITFTGSNNITAVARYTGGAPLVTNTGYESPAYSGGGIAIYAGLPTLNLDTTARNLALNRTAAGTGVVSPGANILGANIQRLDGGTVELIATGPGEIDVPGASIVASGGVISIDPPGFPIFLNGGNFLAVGPILTPTALVPIAPLAMPAAGAPGAGGAGPGLGGSLAISFTLSQLQAEDTSVAARQVSARDTARFSVPVGLVPQQSSCNATVALDSKDGDDGTGFFIASGACQSFELTSGSDAIAVGENGTAIASSGKNKFVMRDGRMVLLSANESVTVDTGKGRITVAPHSSVIVEHHNNVVRVANLDGDTASVSVGNKPVSANRGEELVIADSSITEEELIPSDGVERLVVDAKITVAGTQVHKNSFEPRKMLESDPINKCLGNCFSQQTTSQINKLKQKLGVTADADRPARSLKPGYSPVAFVEEFGVRKQIKTDTVQISGTPDAKVTMLSSSRLELHAGDIIASASRTTSVKCGNHDITIGPAAIVLLSRNASSTKLRVLSEPRNQSVTVAIGKKSICVSSGQEVTFDYGDLKKAMQDGIARRRVMSNATYTLAEYSMVSLLRYSSVLQDLIRRSDDRQTARVLKTCVALSMVTSSHGAYSVMFDQK